MSDTPDYAKIERLERELLCRHVNIGTRGRLGYDSSGSWLLVCLDCGGEVRLIPAHAVPTSAEVRWAFTQQAHLYYPDRLPPH